MYTVQSRTRNTEYEVDTTTWTCTCSIGRTGQSCGEPCKHQHAVANKYNLTAPNLVPYFNGDGRYLHAIVALRVDKAGDRSFYSGITESGTQVHASRSDCIQHIQEKESIDDHTVDMDCDSGAENLDLMVELMGEHTW